MTQGRPGRPVGRPPVPERRAEILDAAAREVAERGVDTLTLAGLAKALGFSTYTLTYHFGGKEQLLAAIVEHVETGLQADLEALAASATPAELLRRYWRTAHEPGARSYLRLWLELAVLAGRRPERFPGFRERAAQGWRALAERVLHEHTADPALAALVVAAVTGLEVELMLDPDSTRADQVIDLLAALLGERPAP